MAMRLNIENAARSKDAGTLSWLAETLVANLKELRDRTDRGDMAALDEFFAVLLFSDNERTPRPKSLHADRAKMGLAALDELHRVASALGLLVGTTVTKACTPAVERLAADAALLDWMEANPRAVGRSTGYGRSVDAWWWSDRMGFHHDASSLRDAIEKARASRAAGS